MRRYEICLILKPDIGDDGFKTKIESIKERITKDGAVFIKEDIWGLRQLAYQIATHKKAYYAFLIFDILPDNVLEIKREFQLDEEILRSIIKLEKQRRVVEKSIEQPEAADREIKLDEGDIEDDIKEVDKSDYGESE